MKYIMRGHTILSNSKLISVQVSQTIKDCFCIFSHEPRKYPIYLIDTTQPSYKAINVCYVYVVSCMNM